MLWVRSVQVPLLAYWPATLVVNSFSADRGTTQRDGKAHEKFQAASLSVKGVITWHQIPTKNEHGDMEFRSWPMILPYDLARTSGIWTLQWVRAYVQ